MKKPAKPLTFRRVRLTPFLSKAIVYFREMLKMTQEMLAEASGLSPSAIKRLEKGRKRGGWTDTLEDVCDGLGITIIELYGAAQRLAMQEVA